MSFSMPAGQEGAALKMRDLPGYCNGSRRSVWAALARLLHACCNIKGGPCVHPEHASATQLKPPGAPTAWHAPVSGPCDLSGSLSPLMACRQAWQVRKDAGG